jgi:hypothetical protein
MSLARLQAYWFRRQTIGLCWPEVPPVVELTGLIRCTWDQLVRVYIR